MSIMGITIQSARFDGQLPDLQHLVAEMTRSSGLAVTVHDSTPEVKGQVFQVHCRLAFACEPRESVEISAYQSGAARQGSDRLKALAAIAEKSTSDPVVLNHVRQLLDAPTPANEQSTMQLRGYVGEEGTLFGVAELALESLGGTLRTPMSDARRHACSGPLDPATLRARHRARSRAMRNALISGLGHASVSFVRRQWGRLWRRS
jgi:hypothetical protein